jgi:hypothetical protein
MRFQSQLPFEPVDRARLAMLKVERSRARRSEVQGLGQYVDKRRQAQIAARHALQQVAAGLTARGRSARDDRSGGGNAEALAAAAHAAELQLPVAWLPFVVSR